MVIHVRITLSIFQTAHDDAPDFETMRVPEALPISDDEPMPDDQPEDPPVPVDQPGYYYFHVISQFRLYLVSISHSNNFPVQTTNCSISNCPTDFN